MDSFELLNITSLFVLYFSEKVRELLISYEREQFQVSLGPISHCV